MTEQPTVPEPAASYFARFGLGAPIVDQVYHPDRGWRELGVRVHWYVAELPRLRRQGFTHVRLSAGRHHADFALQEFP